MSRARCTKPSEARRIRRLLAREGVSDRGIHEIMEELPPICGGLQAARRYKERERARRPRVRWDLVR